MDEKINHPPHYGGDTVYEAIKVIEAWELGFCLGNTVKYISRAGKKSAEEELTDLKKAAWYLARHIQNLEPDSTAAYVVSVEDEMSGHTRLFSPEEWKRIPLRLKQAFWKETNFGRDPLPAELKAEIQKIFDGEKNASALGSSN